MAKLLVIMDEHSRKERNIGMPLIVVLYVGNCTTQNQV